MILSASVIAATSAALLLSSGYLFGVRRGVTARRALRASNEHESARVHALELRVAELTRAADEAARLRVELERAARSDTDASDRAQVTALQNELVALGAMLREREAHEATLRAELRTEIMALAQGERDPVRLGRELAQLEIGASLGELPTLLDAIAQKGGFASVVLSDDVGLPLAASSNASSVDWLAGMASLVLTLVERSERAGEPRPIGVVIHDESNQRVLHRIFRVGGARFLLTAVTKGHDVSPSALDAALGKLERALARG